MASLYEKFFNKKPPLSGKSKFQQEAENPPTILSRDYIKKTQNFTPESKEDIRRFMHLFSRDLKPLEMYIDQMSTEGRSDIKNFTKFMHPDDKMKWGDYNYLGKKTYDMTYRKDTKRGQQIQKEFTTSPWLQVPAGVSTGVWNTIAGTAELGAALSDLALDTDYLPIIEKALPSIELMDIYGDKAGSVAKFSSILVQYGLV